MKSDAPVRTDESLMIPTTVAQKDEVEQSEEVGWIAESLQQGTQSGCNAQKGQNPKQGEIGDEEKQKEIRDSFVTEEVQNHVQNPGKPEPLF